MNAYSLFWTLIASFLIAGACVRRTLSEALERLGLIRPTGQEVILAVAAAFALVLAFHFIDPALAALVDYLGLPVTDTEAVKLLFTGSLTLPGIIVASIAAGFGEEVSIRGLLQPRFGILLPALLFASLHAFQYAGTASFLSSSQGSSLPTSAGNQIPQPQRSPILSTTW